MEERRAEAKRKMSAQRDKLKAQPRQKINDDLAHVVSEKTFLTAVQPTEE